MKYVVVAETSCINLFDRVEHLLREGWELQGGVSIAYTAAGWTYAQAMVYKEKR